MFGRAKDLAFNKDLVFNEALGLQPREDRLRRRCRLFLHFRRLSQRLSQRRQILSRWCAASRRSGMLGVAMAIVVIGRGIDLAIVATYAMSAAWTLHLAAQGVAHPARRCCSGFLLAVAVGRRQRRPDRLRRNPGPVRHAGHGGVRLWLRALRAGAALRRLHAAERRRRSPGSAAASSPACRRRSCSSRWSPLLGYAFLRFTKPGRFIYAIGDNFAAARNSGAPGAPRSSSCNMRFRRVDRLCRRHDHGDRGLQHEHQRRQLLADL